MILPIMNTSSELPYHLRAPRLRWAQVAIDLSSDEELAARVLSTNASVTPKIRTKAALLLGLHMRKPIPELCAQLQLDRRTLFRMASDMKINRPIWLQKVVPELLA
jgi:hypothetical protein